MKKGLPVIGGGILVGVLVFGIVSVLAELIPFVPWLVIEVMKWGLAFFCGREVYKYLFRKSGISQHAKDALIDKKVEYGQMILYFLLIFQLAMSIGIGNEFDDYLFVFIFSVIFFVFQIYFLFHAYFKKGVTALILTIAFLHLFSLIAFLDEGVNIISNKWPIDSYNATYTLVVCMLIGALVLDAIKLGVLYRDIILKVIKKKFCCK